MIRNTAGKSSVKMVSRFAYAAGATGILANLFLVAFLPCRPVSRTMDSPSVQPTT